MARNGRSLSDRFEPLIWLGDFFANYIKMEIKMYIILLVPIFAVLYPLALYFTDEIPLWGAVLIIAFEFGISRIIKHRVKIAKWWKKRKEENIPPWEKDM